MKKEDMCPHKNAFTMLIIAKKWKQLKCSSTDEWINKCGISIV